MKKRKTVGSLFFMRNEIQEFMFEYAKELGAIIDRIDSTSRRPLSDAVIKKRLQNVIADQYGIDTDKNEIDEIFARCASRKTSKVWKLTIDVKDEWAELEEDFSKANVKAITEKLETFYGDIEYKIDEWAAVDYGHLISDIDKNSNTEEDFDAVWNELYDFCDEHEIWLATSPQNNNASLRVAHKRVLIQLKTKLKSGSIVTTANHNGISYNLYSIDSGEFILSLPEDIKSLPHDGIIDALIYEDDSILVRI